MKGRFEFPKTYAEACSNLTNNYHSQGFNVKETTRKEYINYNTPLERIVLDLAGLKNFYTQLRQSKNSIEIDRVIESITAYRAIILEAISTLSDEELIYVTFKIRHPFHSLLEFLAEIGEVALFKAAFNKLQPKLSQADISNIFRVLLKSYEGSGISEGLGLASSTLKRGNVCYAAMVEWMLNDLRAKGSEFLPTVNYEEDMENAKNDFDGYAPDLKSYQDSAWQDASKEQDQEYDEALVRSAAEIRFHQFVTQPAEEHLFLKAAYNFSLSASPIYEESSFEFLFRFLISKEFLVALLALTILCAAVSGVGVGIAAAGMAVGTGLAVGGLIGMGVGAVSLGSAGFFAYSNANKDLLERFEKEENDFYVGVSL